LVEFRILGPMEVLDEDRSVPLPRGRGRVLLAILVLRAGEVVSTDRLIYWLWGETPPPTAITALHGHVSTLRKRLKPPRSTGKAPTVLKTRPPGYVLAIDRGAVDAHRFRRLLEEVADAPAPERAAKLRTALALWRGPALADFTYEPFAQTDIAVLEELRMAAIEERIDADLALSRHAELVGELKDLIAEQPLRERLREQLMLALYRSGRQAEALEVYRTIRQVLVEELGIEPGPALQTLEQAILRQEASLDLRPAPPFSEVSRERPAARPPLEAQPWLPPGRKTVTVAFLDLSPSTSLGASLDPEALRRIVRRYVDTAADVITRHGGTVERLIGDTVVAVFGIPTAHEDDALRTVRAAIELRADFAAVNEELTGGIRLAARAGIDTGEVLVGDPAAGQPMVTGEAVTVAARLQQAAAEGEILVSEGTRRLVQDAARFEQVEHPTLEVQGRPVTTWRLLGMVPGTPGFVRRLDAPMVGRAAELAWLRAAFDRTVQERSARSFTVVGEAGIGKSRLAREFAESLGSDALVLVGRCPAYGEGMTFWALREIVMQVAGPGREGLLKLLAGEDDAELIADQVMDAVGLTETSGRPNAPFPALRRLFEVLARRQPVAVIFEDVHWAQPTLLDFIEYLTEWTRQTVFLLCLARPELLEERGTWAGSKENALSLVLEPLGPEDIEKLIADRLAGRTLPPETVDRVAETSQGNPLFVEQLLAALKEEGRLTIPASMHALLTARLDRLGPAERDLIRTASVMGADFSVEALVALLSEEVGPFAGRHLQALERKQLIRPSELASTGEETFSFCHVLIQLAAYRSMTRETRSELHERFAGWLEGEAAEITPGFEEVVGSHLEQAYEQRRRLGLLDAHSRALAKRAGEWLASAGLRAFGRFDVAAAENLWSRAKSLLPPDHIELPQVRRYLVEAYQVLGRHTDADAVLGEMLDELRADEDRPLEQVIGLERARICLFTGPDPVSLRAVREEAERALEVLGESGDEAGLALGCYVLGHVHMLLGEIREMEKMARRGLDHAIRSGEPREEAAARLWVALALVLGETPVPACLHACEKLAPWLGMEHPLVLCELAGLRAMLGNFDEARDLIARARRLVVERIRARRPLMFAAGSSASVEVLAGDLAASERELRTALQMAIGMQEREWVSQFAAGLSRVLFIQGSGEAERFSVLSFETAPSENVAAQVLWRSAKARALDNRGDHWEAERLAREAIQLVPREMLNLGADVRVDLAEILLAAGRRKAALPVICEAIDLYKRKGNLVSAARLARSNSRSSPSRADECLDDSGLASRRADSNR
jgi:DNA-binding SARP family transcriptional activator/class 3 adenylate cyclase/tetratricopeptide (TPR) repeat protein